MARAVVVIVGRIAMPRTEAAFAQFRQMIGSPRGPRPGLIANEGETRLMTDSDGLRIWGDGGAFATPAGDPPAIPSDHKEVVELWVVRSDDVVYAREKCVFGKKLPSGVIKHTNLTGGEPAYCGGELIALDRDTVVVSGCSGRYGPNTSMELKAVAQAFKQSGYAVCSMGWDLDANRPNPFIGLTPSWV